MALHSAMSSHLSLSQFRSHEAPRLYHTGRGDRQPVRVDPVGDAAPADCLGPESKAGAANPCTGFFVLNNARKGFFVLIAKV